MYIFHSPFQKACIITRIDIARKRKPDYASRTILNLNQVSLLFLIWYVRLDKLNGLRQLRVFRQAQQPGGRGLCLGTEKT
jgi:hypothetical protein